MGRIAKGTKCSVVDCCEPAVRSISTEKAESAGLKVVEERRAYLCRGHYKELKRKSRDERRVERWRWGV